MQIRHVGREKNFPEPGPYAGCTVLAIGAHPDDVELAVGGIVARWSRAGFRVVIAVVEDLEPHDLVRLLDEQVRELVHEAAVACQRLRHFDCFSYHPNFCRPVPVTFEPRVYVDISSTIEMKMAAIDAHESQFGGRGITTDIFREIAQLTGRYIGVPYAEGLEINRMRIS